MIASSRKASVNRALEVLPAGTQGHAVDLSDEARIRELFEGLGAFDHLVYTAGENLTLGALEQTTIDEARRFWTLRYWGALAAVKYGSPNIRNGGSIVLTSGLAGRRTRAYPGQHRLPRRGQNAAVGQYDRSRPHRAVPADG